MDLWCVEDSVVAETAGGVETDVGTVGGHESGLLESDHTVALVVNDERLDADPVEVGREIEFGEAQPESRLATPLFGPRRRSRHTGALLDAEEKLLGRVEGRHEDHGVHREPLGDHSGHCGRAERVGDHCLWCAGLLHEPGDGAGEVHDGALPGPSRRAVARGVHGHHCEAPGAQGLDDGGELGGRAAPAVLDEHRGPGSRPRPAAQGVALDADLQGVR